MSYSIPKDYHTLLKWGSLLNNCVGNYHSNESYKDLLLIGIFKNNNLKFLVSLKCLGKYKEISQFKGFKNSDPTPEELSLLISPLKPFILDSQPATELLVN